MITAWELRKQLLDQLKRVPAQLQMVDHQTRLAAPP